MAFTEIQTVRNITGVSTDDYTDEQVQEFIGFAQKEVTSKVQQKVLREKILRLDSTRENEIDGITTTFYLKNWNGNHLTDMDYDGDVDTDDIKVYSVDSNGAETVLAVSSIDTDDMTFTLSSAPNNVDLYATYCYSQYDFVNPDPLLSQCTAFVAASYLDITETGGSGGSESVRIGNLSISESGGGRGLVGNKYYQKYLELLNQLIENSTGGAIWGESFVKI
jgi:hypothetical protein